VPHRQLTATGLSRRGTRETVSWLATGSWDPRRFKEDQWPVADALSVADVTASQRFHYRADRGNGSTRGSGVDGDGAALMRRSPRRR
jgi:hypothetical protein